MGPLEALFNGERVLWKFLTKGPPVIIANECVNLWTRFTKIVESCTCDADNYHVIVNLETRLDQDKLFKNVNDSWPGFKVDGKRRF